MGQRPWYVPVAATLLFQVDVTPIRDLGLFDETDGDSLKLFGGFNGWDGASLDQSLMRQSLTDPAIFEIAVPISRVPGSVLEYKYFIAFDTSSVRFDDRPAPDGWEEPGSTGGGNRTFEFGSQAQQIVGTQAFNDIFTVVPEGVSYTMNFTADMSCYLRDPNNGNPQSDTLKMDIADPFWHWFNGTLGDDGFAHPSFSFTDADRDSIYDLSLAVTGPIPNWVQYKLNWAGLDEAGPGFDLGRRRVRYARANADGSFNSDYQMGLDYWNEDNAQPLTVESEAGGPIDDTPPCVLTGVSENLGDVPDTYDLSQNYPNPFNPNTTISFKLPAPDQVKLAVYNMLGQKVADLVDEVKQAGTHQITLDFTNAISQQGTSGVYFYKLTVGDGKYVQTRKMTLLK